MWCDFEGDSEQYLKKENKQRNDISWYFLSQVQQEVATDFLSFFGDKTRTISFDLRNHIFFGIDDNFIKISYSSLESLHRGSSAFKMYVNGH